MLAWEPEEQTHFLIADPIGVHPLYWARTADGRIVTSPVLAAILDRPGVDDALDYEGILLDQGGAYLLGADVAHRTSFTAVAKVPGGQALRIDRAGTVRRLTYWDPTALPEPDRKMSLADCADVLRERLEVAVRRLAPRDGAVGSHVSGGVDCTTIACLADQWLRESGNSLRAGYSWSPSPDLVPRFPGDERDLLDDVEQMRGFPIRTIGAEDLGEWFWMLDPARYPDTDHLREAHTLRQAEHDGVTVMLSGWGGDELASYNGRNIPRHLLRTGRITAAWREQQSGLALHTGQTPSFRRQLRGMASLSKSALAQSTGWTGRLRRKSVDLRAREIDAALRAYSPTIADLRQRNMQQYRQATSPRQLQEYLLQYGHLQRRTAGWHQTGTLFGIHYRYPLLDLDVVEAALQLPWWAFRSGGWSRPAFRLAIEPWVPASVAWNVSKLEPALRHAPAGDIGLRSMARRRRHLDDPEYEAVMDLAMSVRDTGAAPVPAHLRVTARPDRAL